MVLDSTGKFVMDSRELSRISKNFEGVRWLRRSDQQEPSYTSQNFSEILRILEGMFGTMASEAPHPTPEGTLIKRIRESLSPRVSVAQAAKQAGISADMWAHIERGHRSAGRGAGRSPVVAKASTLAHMGFAIGATPEDLEQAKRADAAEILRTMKRDDETPQQDLEVMHVKVDRGTMLLAVPPDLSDEDREQVRRQAEELAAYLDRRRQGTET